MFGASNGYKNAAYAIAELMDNAVQAGATLVELICVEKESLSNRDAASASNRSRCWTTDRA
jgi:hypothetical protein